MVESIQAYKDASGKIHEDVFTAHRADFIIWLAKCDAINEASAKQIVDWLLTSPEMIDTTLEMLKALRDHMPERVMAVS